VRRQFSCTPHRNVIPRRVYTEFPVFPCLLVQPEDKNVIANKEVESTTDIYSSFSPCFCYERIYCLIEHRKAENIRAAADNAPYVLYVVERGGDDVANRRREEIRHEGTEIRTSGMNGNTVYREAISANVEKEK